MELKFQMLVIVLLTLVSTSFQSDSSCGNGFLDEGEECDCGTKEECKRVGETCCNYTSCMLNDGAQCTEGVCCSNCQFVARGTVCRDVNSTCDVPEYCNGTSEVCPADLVVANGISCKNDQGYCRGGECKTHNEQCDEMWNGGAFKANDACYEVLNLRGDKEGYCKKKSDSTYTACTSKNGQCGKLWCVGTGITPKDRGYNYYQSEGTLNHRRITCRSVQIYQAPGLPELATVLDGIKCGDKMVCQNNECVSLSIVYGGQRTCANNCNGNGVCNENGNCHCNPGWKCPNCSEAYNGTGGSRDSGLDCESVTPAPCQCAEGSCCRNCQIVSRGTVCRDAENSCDVPEYCDGTSATCPVDLKTTNGLTCKNGQGYCHGGECRTYNEQCDYLWFGGAFKANDACYEVFNLRGDKHGYCKRYSSSSYLACTSENVQCGKLWCVGNGEITAKNLLYGNYFTTATLKRRTITCRSVQIYQSPGKPALGTVLDGTKCGKGKVCQNNMCVTVEVANAGQRTCANNCNGNGVCNENGNCHCNPGWKCPNCIEAYDGPGGSIDNGLSCQAAATTTIRVAATTATATTSATTATTTAITGTAATTTATTTKTRAIDTGTRTTRTTATTTTTATATTSATTATATTSATTATTTAIAGTAAATTTTTKTRATDTGTSTTRTTATTTTATVTITKKITTESTAAITTASETTTAAVTTATATTIKATATKAALTVFSLLFNLMFIS